MKFTIDVNKTVSENAEFYYKKVKRVKKKIEGAERALNKTIELIKKLKNEEIKEKIPEKKERKRKKWYEKFRFFHSSDGFLVIGGKDATSNEILIKRYMESNDLVFHSDIHGAPFFIIKNPDNREIPESTKNETAQATASYSRAWTSNYASVDVYAIKPEQVSKHAPSGEYLTKGAFMIYGKKEWFRKTILKIAIGFKIDRYAEVIGGPLEAVKKNSDYFVSIIPGDKKSKRLAEEIKNKILSKAKKEHIEKIKSIDLHDIQRLIPAGKGRIEDN